LTRYKRVHARLDAL